MVKQKVFLKVGAMLSMLSMLSVGGYAAGSATVAKPEVQRVVFYDNKWTIVYKDVNTSTPGYVSERVIVDGYYDRQVPVGNHETRSFSFVNGPYAEGVCHQVRIEVLNASNRIVATSDRFNFGDTTDCANVIGKPEIHTIDVHNGNWRVLYKDVSISGDVATETLFIDGEVARADLPAGVYGPDDRGFYLPLSNYSQTECHLAHIKIYDNQHEVVTTSDTFYFGDTSGECSLTPTADTTPPTITLVGASTQTIKVGDAYEELGATAFDSRDGDITPNITIDASAVDTAAEGSYAVTYTVSDVAGNTKTVTRTVNVTTAVVKPDIHRIVFDSRQNKWFIVYKDVPILNKYTTEDVSVNGTVDRIVPAGINGNNDRAFALTGTYDINACNSATILIHGPDNTNVVQSDVFEFGTCN